MFAFEQPPTTQPKKNDGFDLFQFPSNPTPSTTQPVAVTTNPPVNSNTKASNWFDFDEQPKPAAKKQEVNLLDL
jgi:hypothetical protein